MPNKPTRRELALALGLTVPQITALLKIGGIKRTTRRKTIDAIKRVPLTIPQASDVWGIVPESNLLYYHIRVDRLKCCCTEPRNRQVTVNAMLELMDELNRPASGWK